MRTDPVIPAVEPRKPSTFNLEVPGGSEDGPTDYTAVELTVSKLRAVLVGTATPTVTWTVRFGSDRNAAGTEVVTGGTTTTSTTTGDSITSLDEAVIPADSFIWIETTAQSGTVDSITISVVYA
jgi:hypothetical protein